MKRWTRIFFWKIILITLVSIIIEFIPLASVQADPVIYTLSGIVSVPDVWNSSGNAGSIWFYATTNPAFHPYIDTDGTLHGSFWSHNLGWVNFIHSVPTVQPPYMTCPVNVLSGGLVCDIGGYAWSQNAGWIYLGLGADTSISSISSVHYDPDTLGLSGFGYSESVGWIPFESIGVASLTLGFQGRVYVFGNISGKRTYITVYNPTQSAFDSVSFQDFIMSVKRKVAELKRGYFSLNPFLNYQIIENSDYIVPSAGWESSRTRSYIVVGGDIIIKGSVFENPDHPVALIALRNAYGSGGNIYIEGNLGGDIPDTIHASLVAEGSVVSGTKDSVTGVASAYIDTSILNIPINQLYLKGIIASRNTIGGAAREIPICPVSLPLCSEEIARKYDFNYFRNFVSGDEAFNFTHRAYTRSTDMDTYSFVIEYEPRMLQDPPPGLDF